MIVYAMDPTELDRRLAMMGSKITGSNIPTAAPDAPKAGYAIVDGVAHIPIQGVLADQRDFWSELFGDGPALTYSELEDAIISAADDEAVKSIQLDVSSPGGEVSGLTKAVDGIRLARLAKPVKAVISGMGASAAYWLASQAESVTVRGEITQVGSIGVAVAIYKPDGQYDIASSGAPKKRPDPATEAGQAVIREQLDAIHAIFVRQVAEGRGVDVAKVKTDFGQGGLLLADAAKKAGMVDKVIKSPGVAGSAGEANKQAGGGLKMMTLDQFKAENPEALAGVLTQARAEGIQAERDRIAQLSAWKGINEDADTAVSEAIASGKSYSEVASTLAAAVARGKTKDASGDNPPPVQTGTSVNGAGTGMSLSDEERQLCKAMGLDEAAFLAEKKKGVA